MFHGVGIPGLSVEMFRAQVAFLARHFQIVPLAKIWQDDPETHAGRPRIALTFDDGLRNNFTVAYPILRALSAPATFFVCPGLIESRRWLWNHECRARLDWMAAADKRRFAEGLGIEFGSDETIMRRLKSIARPERLAAESELTRLTHDFTPTEVQHQQYDVLSWDELGELDSGLIDIGGHSSHHEILTKLSQEQLEREVVECKTWLGEKLSRPVCHFCYPDGAYDATVRACVGRHFELAVTTEEAFLPVLPSLLDLPRVPAADNVADLAWRMYRPTG
jgi:peptidoglycan/xylan/chitin deacetylase (PgdA/CDA1 family)